MLALLTVASAGVGGAQSLSTDAILKLRFSPNGRYILAQDASEITILTVTPLAILFRIPTKDAAHAQFTPDSQRITFLSGGTHVGAAEIQLAKSGAHLEYWSVVGGTKTDPQELPDHACDTEQLSPDGSVLACDDVFGTLWLIDTASGSTILRKDGFGSNRVNLHLQGLPVIVPAEPEFVRAVFSPDVRIVFSPDARYVIIARQQHYIAEPQGLDREERDWWRGSAVMWDLRVGTPVALRNHLNILVDTAVAQVSDEMPDRTRFLAFLAPDRLLVSDLRDAKKGHVTAVLMEFPSGRLLSRPILPAGALFQATDPNFVIVRLTGQDTSNHSLRTLAVDVHTQALIVSNTPALDILGRYYVAEPRRGWVGLYERRRGLQAIIDLRKK